jgi:hypothetical protein
MEPLSIIHIFNFPQIQPYMLATQNGGGGLNRVGATQWA